MKSEPIFEWIKQNTRLSTFAEVGIVYIFSQYKDFDCMSSFMANTTMVKFGSQTSPSFQRVIAFLNAIAMRRFGTDCQLLPSNDYTKCNRQLPGVVVADKLLIFTVSH